MRGPTFDDGATGSGRPPPTSAAATRTTMTSSTSPIAIATTSGRTAIGAADPTASERVVDRALDQVEQQSRLDAEDDDQRRERHERQDLDRRHVGQVAAEADEEVGHLTEGDALVHPQQVAGGEDHAERGDRRGRRTDEERADAG